MDTIRFLVVLLALTLILPYGGCSQPPTPQPSPTVIARKDALPPAALKIHPDDDPHPPRLHHPGWEEPVPLPDPINTEGGEDSPFIPADGDSLYFFFTPDVTVPAEKQLLDGSTGIYRSPRTADGWGTPARVILNDDLALDGCPFALGNQLWFCTARPGTTGLSWYTAERVDGVWKDWQPAGFNPDHQVGELHLSFDGTALYFGSDRAGTRGGQDLWVSRRVGGEWSQPENLAAVNTEADESQPYLTPDGSELWFTRTFQGTPAVFRAVKNGGSWGEPELIVSQFAGEPTLDREGNLYFVHHFYLDGQMVEVDIYRAEKVR